MKRLFDPKILPSSRCLSGPSFFTSSSSQCSRLFHSVNGIPEIPLLNKMLDLAKDTALAEEAKTTYLIGVQHLLPTTASLFQALIKLGFLPENMLLTGKSYSTVPSASKLIQKLKVGLFDQKSYPDMLVGNYRHNFQEKIDAMWRQFERENQNKSINRLIVLDEGGHCLERIPKYLIRKYPIVGIEQTRGGLYSPELPFKRFPIIQLASSAAKRHFESSIIANSILSELEIFLKNKSYEKLQFGIVGNGAIGSAIAQFLIEKKCSVFFYDLNSTNQFPAELDSDLFVRLDSVESVVRNSDCIFGCTGTDITQHFDPLDLVNNKIFVSCSSEDREFASLLAIVAEKLSSAFSTVSVPIDIYGDIKVKTRSGDTLTIIRGGFPINFNCLPSSDPMKIILTRGLLLGSVFQALIEPVGKKHSVSQRMLDPAIQAYVLNKWLSNQTLTESQRKLLAEHPNEKLVHWIQNNSGGEYKMNPDLQNLFSENLETHQPFFFPS